LKAYALCDQYHDAGDETKAIEQCERAVELDPDFAEAHHQSFVSSWYFRNLPINELKKAYELRGRMDRRQRLRIEARYFQFVNRDVEKAVSLLTEMVRTYPNWSDPHNALSVELRDLGQLTRAAAESRESIRLDPEAHYRYFSLMATDISMERYGEAQAAYEDARSRGIGSESFRPLRFYLAFLQRDTVGMEEQLRWAAENPKARASSQLLNGEASAARYFGHMSSSRRLADHATGVAQSSGWLDLAATEKSQEAVDQSLVGNAGVARDAATRALAFDSVARAKAALALALSGDFTTAEKLAEQTNAEWPQATIVQSFDLPCIRAAIAIGQAKPTDAIRMLEAALRYEFAEQAQRSVPSLCPSYVRGLAYLQAREGQQASAEFQRIIEHPGIVGISLIGPLAHLQLARAQLMMGGKAAARKSYQDFLTLWKDADPDIPIYQQAKAEYAKLQ